MPLLLHSSPFWAYGWWGGQLKFIWFIIYVPTDCLGSRNWADGHHHNSEAFSRAKPYAISMDSICLWLTQMEFQRWAPWLMRCVGIFPAISGLVLLNLRSSTSWPGFWKLLAVCSYLCLLVSLGSFILCHDKCVLFSSLGPWTLAYYEFKDENCCVWEIVCLVSLWELGLRPVSDGQISPSY